MPKFRGRKGEFYFEPGKDTTYVIDQGEGGLWSTIILFITGAQVSFEVEGTIDTVYKKLKGEIVTAEIQKEVTP